jgi:hypothetical protein
MLGWMKVYHFKGVAAPLKVDNRVYSAAQLSLCDSFGNWIQASYIPKGGLGDIKKTVSEKLGLYNQHTAALPQSYGVFAKTYYFLKYNSSNKLVPATSHSVQWGIMANGVPSDWEIRDICTPTQYYFTFPSFESSENGGELSKLHDLTKIEQLKPYTCFWVKNVEAGNGTDYVLLSKDNRSPFIKITKGEYLQLLEAAIPKVYEEEKKKLYQKEQGNQKSIAVFMKYLDEKKEKWITGLKNNKEKYKGHLDEPAMTSNQPSLYDLDNGRDIFSNGYLTDPESTTGRMPVYKIDPVMAELCKKDKPQWILVSWWWAPNDPLEKHLHESIINNFNFEYLYQFFFDPEKIKGKAYKPLRSPFAKEIVKTVELSAAGKKSLADKNVHFFDDFSSTEIGKKPIGWKAGLGTDGTTSVVKKVDGLEGNWALMSGNYTITPTQLKKPLPKDFTLSYELVATQHFPWGGKGLTFQLSKETTPGNAESFLKLKLRPGYDGKNGEAELETNFPYPPGYSNGSKWFEATGFSNNKKNNRITITIKKKEERLQVFIDEKKIAEYEKAIPAALLFNAMTFLVNGSLGENDHYYISNVRITID